jgi:hypothetical protein
MGCASSKPSKDKKSSSKQQKLNKKSKSTDNGIQHSATDGALSTQNHTPNEDTNIRIDKHLIDQIKKNEIKVIEYIVPLVRHEQSNYKQDPENEDLIVDVVSKAINTLVNTPLPNTTLTYKSLNTSLKSWPFICHNQANKTRICDITSETIRDCLATINHELDENSKFDLVQFLTQHSSLTPPQTPKKDNMSTEEAWNEEAILMNRTKANQLARLLFLSNKARPIIHPSTRVKDAYFVNIQLNDNTQVCISQAEIDDLLNNSTYKNNPHISPVPQRKLDFNLMSRSETSPDSVMDHTEDSTVMLEKVETVGNQQKGNLDTTVEDITWLNLTTAEDFEKREVVNLTDQASESVVETSCDTTNLVYQSDSEQVMGSMTNGVTDESSDTNVVDVSEKDSNFLGQIIKEINILHNCADSGEVEGKVVENLSTVTPPPSPKVVREDGEEVVIGDLEEYATMVDTGNVNTTLEADGNLDPVLKQELLDDRFYNNDYKDGPPVNANDAENDAATTIQASFKGEAVRQGQQGEVQN